MKGDRHGGVLLIKRASHSASEPVAKVSLLYCEIISENIKSQTEKIMPMRV